VRVPRRNADLSSHRVPPPTKTISRQDAKAQKKDLLFASLRLCANGFGRSRGAFR
jgi:hypothetical protein